MSLERSHRTALEDDDPLLGGRKIREDSSRCKSDPNDTAADLWIHEVAKNHRTAAASMGGVIGAKGSRGDLGNSLQDLT